MLTSPGQMADADHDTDLAPLSVLTPRELEVFKLVAIGMRNAAIARELHMTDTSVPNYVRQVLRKLRLERRAQVVSYAARLGML